MAEHFTTPSPLVDAVKVHEGFFRPIQQLLSDYISPNFRLTKSSPTAVQVLAGADGDEQVALAIEGKYRYANATVTAAIPAGDGTRYVYATATNNDFSGPDEAPDQTDYGFGLSVRSTDTPPPGAAISRKVGELTVSGGAITDIRPTVAVAQRITRGRSFPTDPLDGDLHVYPAGAAGEAWMFSYNQTADTGVNPRPWEFVGGAPLVAFDETEIATTINNASNWPDATTLAAGAGGDETDVTVPLGGDYEVAFGFTSYTNAAGTSARMAIFVQPATSSPVTEELRHQQGGADMTPAQREVRVQGLAAGAVLRPRYNSYGLATISMFARWLSVRPIRVRGA